MQQIRIFDISSSHFITPSHSYKSFETESDRLAFNKIADALLNKTADNVGSILE